MIRRPPAPQSILLAALLGLTGLCLTTCVIGCADNVADPDGAPLTPPTLQSLEAGVLVPGSVIALAGTGFLSPPAGETEVIIEGEVAGQPVRLTLAPVAMTRSTLRLRLDPRTIAGSGMPAGGGRLDGRVRVVVEPADQPVRLSAAANIGFEFRASLSPVLTSVGPESVAPGAALEIKGEGLISGDEGQSWVVLEGEFEPDDPEESVRTLEAVPIGLTDRSGRRQGEAYLQPGALGLSPGRFEGAAWLRTQAADGRLQESEAVPLSLVQRPPSMRALNPSRAARGQIITLQGDGFLPNDPAAQTATLVTGEGRFVYDDGRPDLVLEGPLAYRFMPEVWVNHQEIRAGLRTQLDPREGLLVGLGANSGVFQGTFTVSLFHGLTRLDTPPIPAELIIAPQTQVVWLDYQPGFSEGLDLFGLGAREVEIRARILEVCRRDFEGLRVEFTERRPTEWAEYLTVEIGGRDPNGLGLFGLDNTLDKDVGNQILSELIGGRNAEAEAAGILPFGGIFVESFLALSPSHREPALIASPRFDQVFGPFSPALNEGAAPVGPTEGAGAPRGQAIAEAVRVLGNLVGSTVTHEVGHALGLAAIEGEVHNPSDTDGGLMDRGEDRPFEERAELDGAGPGRFLGANRSYLESILGTGTP